MRDLRSTVELCLEAFVCLCVCVYVRVCVWVSVCLCVRASACLRVCVSACLRVCVYRPQWLQWLRSIHSILIRRNISISQTYVQSGVGDAENSGAHFLDDQSIFTAPAVAFNRSPIVKNFISVLCAINDILQGLVLKWGDEVQPRERGYNFLPYEGPMLAEATVQQSETVTSAGELCIENHEGMCGPFPITILKVPTLITELSGEDSFQELFVSGDELAVGLGFSLFRVAECMCLGEKL